MITDSDPSFPPSASMIEICAH